MVTTEDFVWPTAKPQPGRVSRTELIAEFERKMLRAIRAYEEQKAVYEAVRESYRKPGRDETTGRLRAAGDPRTGDAAGLGVWYRDEAATYAAVVTALRAGHTTFAQDAEVSA